VSLFGKGPDGEDVHRYTLSSDAGISVDIIDYGASIAALRVPDRTGAARNVVLGFSDMAGYLSDHPKLGASIGRYADRIGGARFTLDGVEYRLAANEGENTLHGGKRGFDGHTWRAIEQDASHLVLEHLSPDGDQGFPGTLTARVTYALSGRELSVEYGASTDKATVVNLTNHTYFNLSGEGSGDVLDHELVLFADGYIPVRSDLMPAGGVEQVSGTPFDFRAATAIGARIRQGDPQLLHGLGYDHYFVLNKPAGAAANQPVHAARLRSPKTGIVLDLHTTEPGLQLFTGNVLMGNLVGPSGHAYRQADGVCLETQQYPDSPNQPTFPPTVLRPGAIFRNRTIFQFGAD